MWIRDGVLIDRMHINPVAFACAFHSSLDERHKGDVEMAQLVNFAFAKSGLSCSEKMQLFNAEVLSVLPDVESAVSLYNDISAQAGKSACYFEGAVDTLQNLNGAGARNFITSAVEQNQLDNWLETVQGLEIAPHLAEALGRRHNFVKGLDHFKYVSKIAGGQSIYYVADAPLEITQAREFAEQCNLSVIGFANHINVRRIQEAEYLLRTISSDIPAIDLSKLTLPDFFQLQSTLQSAGADFVVSDFLQLQSYFSNR